MKDKKFKQEKLEDKLKGKSGLDKRLLISSLASISPVHIVGEIGSNTAHKTSWHLSSLTYPLY